MNANLERVENEMTNCFNILLDKEYLFKGLEWNGRRYDDIFVKTDDECYKEWTNQVIFSLDQEINKIVNLTGAEALLLCEIRQRFINKINAYRFTIGENLKQVLVLSIPAELEINEI